MFCKQLQNWVSIKKNCYLWKKYFIVYCMFWWPTESEISSLLMPTVYLLLLLLFDLWSIVIFWIQDGATWNLETGSRGIVQGHAKINNDTNAKANANRIWIQISMFPFVSHGGSLLGIYLITTNIVTGYNYAFIALLFSFLSHDFLYQIHTS